MIKNTFKITEELLLNQIKKEGSKFRTGGDKGVKIFLIKGIFRPQSMQYSITNIAWRKQKNKLIPEVSPFI